MRTVGPGTGVDDEQHVSMVDTIADSKFVDDEQASACSILVAYISVLMVRLEGSPLVASVASALVYLVDVAAEYRVADQQVADLPQEVADLPQEVADQAAA
jgi:hypothetical protein